MIVDRNGYEKTLKQNDLVGFASQYLKECMNDNSLVNEADVQIYQQLVELDSKFGTKGSCQLEKCVAMSVRIDLVEVKFLFRKYVLFNSYLVSEFG